MPSSASNENKYHWLYKLEEIDKYLERNWDYDHINIIEGHFSPEEFSTYLLDYAKTNKHLGPFKIHAFKDCDGTQQISFYHEKPLSEDDRLALLERKLEILDQANSHDLDIIARYNELKNRRPDLTTQVNEQQ
jgi:hypothetical protein